MKYDQHCNCHNPAVTHIPLQARMIKNSYMFIEPVTIYISNVTFHIDVSCWL